MSAWDDFWLALGPLRKLIQGFLLEEEGKKFAKEFLVNVFDLSFVFPKSILKEIQGVSLAANPLQDDILIWAFSKDGSFNLQSSYLLVKGLNPLNLTTHKLWVWKSKNLTKN